MIELPPAMKARGIFIDVMNSLEHETAELIALHFCGKDLEKRREFLHVVALREQFSLGFKYQIFKFIMEGHHSDFLKSDPELISDYNKMIKFRNQLAHAVSDNEEDDDVILIRLTTKNGNLKEEKIIKTPKDILEYYNRSYAIWGFVREVKDKISKEGID